MKVYLAADHAGFESKELLKRELPGHGFNVVDMGAFSLDPDDDYPDYMRKAAHAVSEDPDARAILIGGSGQGEAIVANRTKGVRAAVYYGGPRDILLLSREHNNSNILSLGARFISSDEIVEGVLFWLGVKFSSVERHARRIKKIDEGV